MATWERLAHVELSGANATLNSGTFSAYKNLKIEIFDTNSGAYRNEINFNSDTGSNYSMNYARIGTNATESSQSKFKMGAWAWNGAAYHVLKITNINDKEKLVISETIKAESGAGNAPNRTEFTGKWANTSSSITSIQITSVASAGAQNVGDGSYITVWGTNPAPATADVITVDSLEAKKHLMVQVKTFTSGGNTKPAMRFNNDSGSNYATRDSQDGGTDATETSVAEIRLSQDGHGGTVGAFALNINVINDASKEKLVTAHTVRSNATGDGTAPARYEIVSKWANTSNAITRVDIINEGTGDFAEGSEVTVYGTD